MTPKLRALVIRFLQMERLVDHLWLAGVVSPL